MPRPRLSRTRIPLAVGILLREHMGFALFSRAMAFEEVH